MSKKEFVEAYAKATGETKKRAEELVNEFLGTVVFPEADIKIFLVADAKERAERRFKELHEKGENISLDNIYENILKRDRLDSTRENSPLKKANDAIEVDTTGKNIEEVKNLILSLYRNKKNISK